MANEHGGFERAVHRLFARAALLAVVAALGAWPLAAAGILLATAKSFLPSTINSGQSARLTISVVDNDPMNPADLLAFSDTFPAGMTLVPGSQSNTCGGSLVTTTNSISLSGGFVSAAGGNCAVTIMQR